MVLIPQGGNDRVYTPDELAVDVITHFVHQMRMDDIILEPCAGKGAFIRAFETCGLPHIIQLELDKGQDFFDFDKRVDWIITNPPWSKARDFFKHGYTLSDNCIWLITVNHLIALKRRMQDMYDAKFGLKEIYYVPTPPAPWPQSGFALGALHVQYGWRGKTKIGGTIYEG